MCRLVSFSSTRLSIRAHVTLIFNSLIFVFILHSYPLFLVVCLLLGRGWNCVWFFFSSLLCITFDPLSFLSRTSYFFCCGTKSITMRKMLNYAEDCSHWNDKIIGRNLSFFHNVIENRRNHEQIYNWIDKTERKNKWNIPDVTEYKTFG